MREVEIPDKDLCMVCIGGYNVGVVIAHILIPRHYGFTLGLWIIAMIIGFSLFFASGTNETYYWKWYT